MTTLQRALEAYANALACVREVHRTYLDHRSPVSADALREAIKRVQIAGEHLSDLLVEEHE